MIVKDASNTGTDGCGNSTSLKNVQDYEFLLERLFALTGKQPFYEGGHFPASEAGETPVDGGPKMRFVTREHWVVDNEPRTKSSVVMVHNSRFAVQTCDAIIARKVLPLDVIKNVVHVGLTCLRPMGAHGGQIISAPFAFASDTKAFERLSYKRDELEFSMKLRPMATLLAGREEASVAWDEVGNFKNTVWFPIEMVCDLLGEPKMEDAATIILLRWTDTHEAMLRRKAYSRQDYKVIEIPSSMPAAVVEGNKT